MPSGLVFMRSVNLGALTLGVAGAGEGRRLVASAVFPAGLTQRLVVTPFLSVMVFWTKFALLIHRE
jgi:hypothetical protein